MPIALQGSPGNAAPGVPFTTRDVDGSPENFVFATGVLAFSGSYTTGGDAADFTKLDSLASQTVVNATAFSQNGSESRDRKSTRLNSSHGYISYAVFCLKKKKKKKKDNKHDVSEHTTKEET